MPSQDSEHADEETLEKIRQAHFLRDIPGSQYLIEYKSLGELFDRRTSEYSSKTFLTYYDDERSFTTSLTYAELATRVNKLGNFLSTGLRLKKGDRVGFVMYNHPDMICLYFACWKARLVAVPVNPEEDDKRLTFTFTNSESKAIFAMEDFVEKAARVRNGLEPKVPLVQVGGKPIDGAIGMEAELSKHGGDFSPRLQPGPENEANIVYTSGTTGPPKGVVQTHYNILMDSDGIGKWHRLNDTHRLMCVLPLHHVNGLITTITTPLLFGASVVLNRRFRAGTFWKRLQDEKVNIVSLVPTIIQILCEKAEDVSKYDLSNLWYVLSAAAPLSVGLATQFEDTFRKRIVHGWGLSEATNFNCFLPPDLSEAEYRMWIREFGFPSIGCSIYPNEVTVHDLQGREVSEGVRGEVVIRGHTVMKYYLKRPDANRDTFKHGWLRTGDEGFYKLDQKGRKFIFLTGRIKELINRAGEKISPFEVEEVLREIPGVKVGLAVSFPNKWYGEEVGAYIIPEESSRITESDVTEYCKKKLPFYKRPKVVIFGKGAPMTSTGKYQRLQLRQLFAEWENDQFRGEDKPQRPS